METLDGTEWDVIITDTGFAASLLALSLSRSGKRVLHLDEREYYGGDEAALSLSEAEIWASRHFEEQASLSFSHASATRRDADGEKKLSSARAYSLALAPHLIYAKSDIVPALVSSQCHNQLDFQAVGSWFIVEPSAGDGGNAAKLTRVPSSREDVFGANTMTLKAKRSLMNFLRFVAAYEEKAEVWQDHSMEPFQSFLEQKFGIPPALHAPILALTMSYGTPGQTTTEEALPRVARHLRSIGIFGPGFGAVLPKWGGLAEISQVACRACAVGGGVYVLKKAIKSIKKEADQPAVVVELDDGERVTATWVCGSETAMRPHGAVNTGPDSFTTVSKSISIISGPMSTLFPVTSEGGVTPAGAVIVVPSTSDTEPPVHILAHTSEAGECPMDQCVLYASIALPHSTGHRRLEDAVTALLDTVDERPKPQVLWKMQYQQRVTPRDGSTSMDGNMIILSDLPGGAVLADAVLQGVKLAWHTITDEDENAFMRFDAREGLADDE